MPEFICDLSGAATPLDRFWEHTVGGDHAPVALRADWQRQLRRCRDESGFRHVRFHGLLVEDVGTLVRHKEKPLYSFFNADQIFDFLLSIGMKPFVELSFMPKALASGGATVFSEGKTSHRLSDQGGGCGAARRRPLDREERMGRRVSRLLRAGRGGRHHSGVLRRAGGPEVSTE